MGIGFRLGIGLGKGLAKTLGVKIRVMSRKDRTSIEIIEQFFWVKFLDNTQSLEYKSLCSEVSVSCLCSICDVIFLDQ